MNANSPSITESDCEVGVITCANDNIAVCRIRESARAIRGGTIKADAITDSVITEAASNGKGMRCY